MIVGQGLAGTLTAFALLDRGAQVSVVDDGQEAAASRISGGLATALAGPRLTFPALGAAGVTHSWRRYQELGRQFGQTFLHRRTMLHPVAERDEIRRYRKRCGHDPYRQWLGAFHQPGAYRGLLADPLGSFEIHGGVVDTAALIRVGAEWLRERNALQRRCFAPSEFSVTGSGIRYREQLFTGIIFCDGASARDNPWLRGLGLTTIPGEVLTLTPESPLPSYIFHSPGGWLAPMPDGRARLGATYGRPDTPAQPTEAARRQLLAQLPRLLARPPVCSVSAHHAGLRPATTNKRPIAGRLPDSPVALLNGLGSRAVLQAPYLAEALADHLLYNQPLPTGCDTPEQKLAARSTTRPRKASAVRTTQQAADTADTAQATTTTQPASPTPPPTPPLGDDEPVPHRLKQGATRTSALLASGTLLLGALFGISPSVQAAEAADERPQVEVYGRINLSIDRYHGGDEYDAFHLASNSSRIGIHATHTLETGLTLLAEVEQVIDINYGRGGDWGSRSAFLGLKDNWGSIKLGYMNTVLKDLRGAFDLFSGEMGDSRNILRGAHNPHLDGRMRSGLRYASPNQPGWGVELQYSFDTEKRSDSQPDYQTPADDNELSAYSAALHYRGERFKIAIGHERFYGSVGTDPEPVTERRAGEGYRLGFSFDLTEQVRILTFGQVTQDAYPYFSADGDLIGYADAVGAGIGLRYRISENLDLRSQYYAFDADENGYGARMVAFGPVYHADSRTRLYVTYANINNDSESCLAPWVHGRTAGPDREAMPDKSPADRGCTTWGLATGIRYDF
nr:porin [Halorhodospira abdelmalekii]